VIEAEGVRLRRAEPDDVQFLVGLLSNEEVGPFLAAVAARTEEEILTEVERSLAEPDAFGRFVVEIREGDAWRPAGLMGFQLRNRRSSIASLERVAVHPDFRGRRLADRAARLFQQHLICDLGFHRLELEIYGFNERAIRHAERSGFVPEGRKRRAYLRHGEWVDGVLFGLTREDLEQREPTPPQ